MLSGSLTKARVLVSYHWGRRHQIFGHGTQIFKSLCHSPRSTQDHAHSHDLSLWALTKNIFMSRHKSPGPLTSLASGGVAVPKWQQLPEFPWEKGLLNPTPQKALVPTLGLLMFLPPILPAPTLESVCWAPKIKVGGGLGCCGKGHHVSHPLPGLLLPFLHPDLPSLCPPPPWKATPPTCNGTYHGWRYGGHSKVLKLCATGTGPALVSGAFGGCHEAHLHWSQW